MNCTYNLHASASEHVMARRTKGTALSASTTRIESINPPTYTPTYTPTYIRTHTCLEHTLLKATPPNPLPTKHPLTKPSSHTTKPLVSSINVISPRSLTQCTQTHPKPRITTDVAFENAGSRRSTTCLHKTALTELERSCVFCVWILFGLEFRKSVCALYCL
jgi:hypothetical protein